MTTRLAPVLALALVVSAHAALLSLALLAPDSKPQEIQQPTVQGVLIAAPSAEVVQTPAARETPPTPKPPEAKPPVQPAPKPKPKPEPKPKPKPKPKPEPAPKPEPKPQPPPVEAPPSEKAISAPPEDVVEEIPEPAESPSEEIAEPAESAAEDAPPPSSPAPADETSETAGAPVVPPRVDAQRMNNPAPAYPRQSRRLREEGTVVLELLILEDGTVGEAKVETSSGYSRLDDTALTAVKRWRYVPATRAGKPIAYTYLQPVVFSLTN